MSSTNSGYDGSMLNGLQSQIQWQTYFDHPAAIVFFDAADAPTFAVLAGFIPPGYIADRFGRRLPIAFGAIIIIIASILQGAAQNYGMFAARFQIGLDNLTHRSVLTTSYNLM
ncbi:hypothetical protein V1515DRAFT_584238 [Lipomyces mesembrius]